MAETPDQPAAEAPQRTSDGATTAADQPASGESAPEPEQSQEPKVQQPPPKVPPWRTVSGTSPRRWVPELKQAVRAAVLAYARTDTEFGARLRDADGRARVVEQIRDYVRLVAAPRRVTETPGLTSGSDQPGVDGVFATDDPPPGTIAVFGISTNAALPSGEGSADGGEPVRDPGPKLLSGLVEYRPRSAADADAVANACARIAAGDTPVRLGGVDWRVLEVRDHQALLLTDHVIGTGPYHAVQVDRTWERCDLRRWLNGFFLDSLGDAFGARVLATQVKNEPNPVWDTEGGADTEDRVFLLSIREAVWYLAHQEVDWRKYKREYFFDKRLSAVDERGDHAWWWLRSPGGGPGHAACVNSGVGHVSDHGGSVSVSSGGVRPALWLNLESTAP